MARKPVFVPAVPECDDHCDRCPVLAERRGVPFAPRCTGRKARIADARKPPVSRAAE